MIDKLKRDLQYKFRIAHVRKDSFSIEGLSGDVTLEKAAIEGIEKSSGFTLAQVGVCPKHGTVEALFAKGRDQAGRGGQRGTPFGNSSAEPGQSRKTSRHAPRRSTAQTTLTSPP